jgi:hypothetical protein
LARRFLICLAFATWCFSNTWAEYAEARDAFFTRHDPLYAVAIPVLCLEAILTIGLLSLWELCRWKRLTGQLSVHLAFLAACLVPLGIASVAALCILPFDVTGLVRNRVFWPMVLTVGIVPLVFALRRPRRASWIARETLLVSWPLLIVLTFQAARGTLFAYSRDAYADRTLAVPISPASSFSRVRVVWIIFDEMSYQVGFGNRPADLKLPNFDRLEESAFHAVSAEPPARATKVSMPSLIVGQLVVEVRPHGTAELSVRIGSSREVQPWSEIDNVFDEARKLGTTPRLWDRICRTAGR